ncbi:hypothetical protein K488DRAFT_92725 [Vararia minispora EC-137]|uniref:Uncharacterized protein n=1 Tax=Vararia minispora EC-137 TaxID=1314806 RepID=A0ACB8Q429_9AGAM|nr:hypothetical protein K488DRAFT_92725 [Vararia minispora EC-137]
MGGRHRPPSRTTLVVRLFVFLLSSPIPAFVPRPASVSCPAPFIPHFQPSLPTLAPDARPPYPVQGPADRARCTPSVLSLAPDPRSRHPLSVPGARTGASRTPRAVCSAVPRSRPSLPTPAIHSQRMDRRIAHAARRQLCHPSLPTLAFDAALRSRRTDRWDALAARRLLSRPSLPSLTPDARPPFPAHGPAHRACRVLSALPSLATDPHSRCRPPFLAHGPVHRARRALSALPSLTAVPHSRRPPSMPGAQTGVSRMPRTGRSRTRTPRHPLRAEAVVSRTTWLARAPGPPAHTGTHAGGTFRVTLM